MANTVQGDPLHLLLVEDNPADARIIEISLREIPLSTRLTIVEDGEEALAFLRQYVSHEELRPDLILLDLHLPKKNGFEVLDEIYSDPQLCKLPVIVCLGSAIDEEQLNRYSLPTECIFTKGYDPERLLQVLTRCPQATNQVT